MRIRASTRADLPEQYDVFRSAIGELYGRHAFHPPDPPFEAFSQYHGHLLDQDPERCTVAEQRGRVLGFAAAFARGETWFLASLFVRPSDQARGVGRELLASVWGSFARRLTMTDSIQPISNALYARQGLMPATPVFTLSGLLRKPATATALRAAQPTAEALAALDAGAYGFDRATDHEYWGSHAQPTLWLRDDRPVAYSYAWDHGRIGPIAGVDGAEAAAAFDGELARRRAHSSFVLVPGTSRELLAAALDAGLRIAGPPGLLLTSEGVPAPTALALSGFSLY